MVKSTLRFWLFLMVIGLAVFAAVWLMGKRLFPDFFTEKPVQIANTPVLLQEIRAIGEWQTATLYAEVVADTLRYSQLDAIQDAAHRIFLPGTTTMGGDRLVVIVRGKVVAGFDWNKLVEESIVVSGDTVSIKLPPAKLLDVIANPTDVTVFAEEGTWPPTTITALTQKGRQKLIAEAGRQNLLQRANEQATASLATMLQRTGFKYVKFIDN